MHASPDPDSVPLLEGIATTRAIRRYRPDPIPDGDLARMFFAASRAPSGSNRQPFRFIVLRDGPRAVRARALIGEAARQAWAHKRVVDGMRESSGAIEGSPKARLADAMDHFVDHFEDAPVVVLACLKRYRSPHPTEGASVYPACQNLLLAARALGYGGVLTIWHAAVEDDLRELLEIPDGVALCATISLGRPAGSHGPVRRQPLGHMVYEDRWDQPAPWAVDPPGTRYTQAGPPKREPR